MARHGTLTRKDFEEVSAAMADLLSAVQATIRDPALSRAQASGAVSLQFASCVNTLATVMARSSTAFQKDRFKAGALKPLAAGELVRTGTAPFKG